MWQQLYQEQLKLPHEILPATTICRESDEPKIAIILLS